MYSERAKYKQVADIDWFGEDLMRTLAENHMQRATIDEWVYADYYWLPGLGLYVIIDIKERDILNNYRGYKQLSSLSYDNRGIFVCSNRNKGD